MKFNLKLFIYFLFFGFYIFSAFAQENASMQENADSALEHVDTALTQTSTAAHSDEASSLFLPTQYREIALGMQIDHVKEQLIKDSIFGYRGDRDVSLLRGENRSLIETSGSSFIRRAWFQFIDDSLYIMSLQLDTERVDYYTLFTSLTAKYGQPLILDPAKSQWVDDACILTLERPLTIKYVDKARYDSLLEASSVKKSYSTILLEGFLDDF